MEKNSAFECGFSSFLGQNRTQFSISFFLFALLFLLFDLEILLVYPYLVSAYTNEIYGLTILLMFLSALTLGFVFELGKKALAIDSKQTNNSSENRKAVAKLKTQRDNMSYMYNSLVIQSSFSNYKLFNRNFWRTYFCILKAKFDRKYIIITLSFIMVGYLFKNYTVNLLDLDMNKLFDLSFIIALCGGFLKAIRHLIELIFNTSQIPMDMTMGSNNTINIETSKQTDKTKYIFMTNGVDEENNSIGNNESDATNNSESSTANNPANVNDNVDIPLPPASVILRGMRDEIAEQFKVQYDLLPELEREYIEADPKRIIKIEQSPEAPDNTEQSSDAPANRERSPGAPADMGPVIERPWAYKLDVSGYENETLSVLRDAIENTEARGGELCDKMEHLNEVIIAAEEREARGESRAEIMEAYKNGELEKPQDEPIETPEKSQDEPIETPEKSYDEVVETTLTNKRKRQDDEVVETTLTNKKRKGQDDEEEW